MSLTKKVAGLVVVCEEVVEKGKSFKSSVSKEAKKIREDRNFKNCGTVAMSEIEISNIMIEYHKCVLEKLGINNNSSVSLVHHGDRMLEFVFSWGNDFTLEELKEAWTSVVFVKGSGDFNGDVASFVVVLNLLEDLREGVRCKNLGSVYVRCVG